MYAFGDLYKSDSKSVIFMNNFLKKWYINNKIQVYKLDKNIE